MAFGPIVNKNDCYTVFSLVITMKIISYFICVISAIGRLNSYPHVTQTYNVTDGTL